MHRVIAVVTCVFVLVPVPRAAQGPVGRGTHLGWDQEAANTAQAQSYVYTLYIDGSGVPLSGVSCSRTAVRRTFECLAPLPILPPGTKALELSAAVSVSGSLVESTRSAPLNIILPNDGIVIEPVSAAGPRDEVSTSGGVALTLDNVASGLSHPTDVSFAPGGVIFVTERHGTVRMLSNGTLHSLPALALADVAASPSGGLLGVALDPHFEANSFGYFVYAALEHDALTYRLARFRFAGGSFAERVVLLDGIPAEPGRLAASLRFGPDGLLYVAFGDTAEQHRDDLASFNGKVLRLNADGTTPRDQPAASPIYASGLTAPRGLAWNPDDGALWILNVVNELATELRVVDGTPRGITTARAVPLEAGATSMVRYDHAAMPSLKGSVLIAANGRLVVRSQVDRMDDAFRTPAISLAHDDFDDVRLIAVGPDGELYAVNDSGVLTRVRTKN